MRKKKKVFLPLEGVGKDTLWSAAVVVVIGEDVKREDKGISGGRGFPRRESGTDFCLDLIPSSRDPSRVRGK